MLGLHLWVLDAHFSTTNVSVCRFAGALRIRYSCGRCSRQAVAVRCKAEALTLLCSRCADRLCCSRNVAACLNKSLARYAGLCLCPAEALGQRFTRGRLAKAFGELCLRYVS